MVLQGRMGKISMGELMNETLQMTKYLLFLSLLLIGCSKEEDPASESYTCSGTNITLSVTIPEMEYPPSESIVYYAHVKFNDTVTFKHGAELLGEGSMIKTKLVPSVTKSNDTYYIEFKKPQIESRIDDIKRRIRLNEQIDKSGNPFNFNHFYITQEEKAALEQYAEYSN